jgi:hypothetical protein
MPSRRSVMPVPSVRPKVLISLLATLAIGLSLLTVVVSGPARADARDGGTITPGTQVTATFAGVGDAITYTVQVPAGRRLTLTAAESSAPVLASLSANTPERGWPITQPLGNVDGFGWFSQLRADPDAPHGIAPVDRTLTLKLYPSGPGVLPFTAGLVSDPEPTAITTGIPTTVHVTAPGQQVPFTVPSVPGHLIGVRVSSVDVSGAHHPVDPDTRAGYSFASVTSPWGRTYSVEKVADGVFRPRVPASTVDPTATGPWTIRLGAAHEGTGTYVIEIVDATFPTSTGVRLDTPATFDAEAPVAEARYTYRAVPGRRLVLTVTESSLARSDGTPGTASAWLVVAGFTRNLGTISNRPVVFGADEPMLNAANSELVIRTDGRSTGKVTFTLSLADDPTVALAIATPGTGTVTTAGQSLSFTFPVTSGTGYKVVVTDVALHSPSDPTLATYVYTVRPSGSTSLATTLTQSDTSGSTAYGAAENGTASVLVDPHGDVVGSLTITVTAIVVPPPVTTPLVNGSPVTATATAGQLMVFTFPGAPGGALPTFQLTDVALTGTSSGNTLAIASLAQGGRNFPGFGGVNDTATTATLTVPRSMLAYGFDPSKPWELRIDLYDDVRGSLTVTLELPTAP